MFKTTFGWIEKLVERKILLLYNAEQPKNTTLLHAVLIEQILNAYQNSELKVTNALSFYVTKTVLVGPKWFWSDQIDLDLTIMIWSQPK